MNMSGSGRRLEMPSGMRSKLEDYRRRVWQVKVVEGVLAAVFGLVVSYLVVLGLDRLWDTPAWLRGAVLVLGATGLGLFLPMTCHRWVWRTRQMEQVARLLQHAFPRLGDELLGVVELARDESEQRRSETLIRAAMARVDESVRDQDFPVPNPRHRVWALAAGAAMVVAMVAMVLIPAAGTNALLRWMMPWRDTPRYTFAQLAGLPESLVVPYAEPFEITAALAEESAWRPRHGTARFGEQEPVVAALADNSYRFAFRSQSKSDIVRVSTGDTQGAIRVLPTVRPELIGMTASVRLPEYLGYSDDPTIDVRGGSVSLVRGSQARFEATVNRELAELRLDGVPQTIRKDRMERITTEPVPVEETCSREFTWRDRLGLTPKEPFQVRINALDDTSPTLFCQDPPRQRIVLETDALSFDIKAADDFGVKEVGLEWVGVEDPLDNPEPSSGSLIVSAGGPERRTIDATATFSAQRQGVPPQTLKMRAYVEDYFPGRARTYSATYVVYVLSPDQHAIWVNAELRRWFRQAEEVHERELGLHDVNRRLRQLSPEELDRPENRQRISQQAAAEQANAQRLKGLTGRGEKLIQQALRNEKFEVPHLEIWAQTLKELKKIAKERMPSVADLLKEAANAPGKKGKPGENKPSESKPGPSAPKVGENRNKMGSKPPKPGEAKKQNQGNSPPIPKIEDVESGFNEPSPSEPSKPGPPKTGSFTLPKTLLKGGPKSDEQKPADEPTDEQSPAQAKVDEAIEDQADLLAEFAKVRDALEQVLRELENSTFVKRFKAASRTQLEIVETLNGMLLGGFGVDKATVAAGVRDRSASVAEREDIQSERVKAIQEDLDAYFRRKQQAKFKVVLDDMGELNVVPRLTTLAARIRDNLGGESISHAEFWADTLDRWAEELVEPSKCKSCKACKKCKKCGQANLSPALVLELLRILKAEMDLREQTRSLEQARAALAADKYGEDANAQAATQATLKERTVKVVEEIREAREEPADFADVLGLLDKVVPIMQEARGILARPETGPEAIAAETEVIELLLEAKRAKSCSGGGSCSACSGSASGSGGSSPGFGGPGEPTQTAALASLGMDDDGSAVEQRLTHQATGKSGRELPEEFREGLDAFFAALESHDPAAEPAEKEAVESPEDDESSH